MTSGPSESQIELRFGTNASWQIPCEPGIASFIDMPHPPLSDIASALDLALREPIEFPSFDQSFVPGDQLALAVDSSLPRFEAIVAETILWFVRNGVPLANMRVVIAADCTMSPSEISSLIQEKLEGEVAVELHDLDDPTKVAYVAANEASDPIYLNRSLVDADLVIPITCARPRMSLDYLGAYSLFPLFSNRETRGRFYSLPSLIDFDRRSELQAWADQAAWWLGIVAGIQVIPAGGGQIASILAGQLAELEIAAQKKMNQIWSTKSGASDMVVMLLENSGGGQSWLDVARGLHSATCCTTHGGTVVLCTQIECAVGKGLNRLREPGRSLEQIANKLASDTHDDAIAAAVILQATSDNHVYLVSAIRSETVESLGMGVIENAAGLSHLISQHATCTILGSAQHRVIVPRN